MAVRPIKPPTNQPLVLQFIFLVCVKQLSSSCRRDNAILVRYVLLRGKLVQSPTGTRHNTNRSSNGASRCLRERRRGRRSRAGGFALRASTAPMLTGQILQQGEREREHATPVPRIHFLDPTMTRNKNKMHPYRPHQGSWCATSWWIRPACHGRPPPRDLSVGSRGAVLLGHRPVQTTPKSHVLRRDWGKKGNGRYQCKGSTKGQHYHISFVSLHKFLHCGIWVIGSKHLSFKRYE